MARWLILGVAAWALMAYGYSEAASSSLAWAASAGCGPTAGDRTLAASPEARVYSLGGSVYGCTSGSGRRYRLGAASLCNGSARVGPVAVAAKLAAYALQRCGVDTSTALVEVRRLSDGQERFSHAASSLMLGPESFESVGSIVIAPTGRLAWIASESSIVTHRHAGQVVEASGSAVRVLQTGSAIEVGSLRLRGSKLTWRAGGSERSAKLA